MAEETTTTKKVKQQGADGVFWLVNPAGAVHNVDKEHAQRRLMQPGWRLATEPEISKAKAAKMQVFDNPICKPWTADPAVQLADLE